MNLSATVGWPIAKATFGDIMVKIEQGQLSWDDRDRLWRARMDSKSDAYMGQNRGIRTAYEQTAPPPQYPRQGKGGSMGYSQNHHQDRGNMQKQGRGQHYIKEYTCRNYNAGFCREQQDHWDPNLPHKYIHACQSCYGNPAIPPREQRHKAKHCTNRMN